MRLSLIAVSLCAACLAGVQSAQARPYYGNDGDRYERAHAKWTGQRRVSVRHNAQIRDVRRQYSYRRSGNRYGAHQYRYGAHRQYSQRRAYGRRTYASWGGRSVGGRPRAWCGWWMRTQLGGGPEFNLAANWRRYGRASGPQIGAVVVWPHHVGIITGRASNGRWIVKSGNDGGRVRERAQSVAGAVFRVG